MARAVIYLARREYTPGAVAGRREYTPGAVAGRREYTPGAVCQRRGGEGVAESNLSP